MNIPQRDSRGWYSIVGSIEQRSVEGPVGIGHIDMLSITEAPPLTVKRARLLRQLHSVARLWLWCDVSRIAMRHLLQIPGLEILDVLAVKGPGALSGFERAASLHTLRANHYLNEQDIFAIAKCAPLRELGIQGAKLTRAAIRKLLELPQLESLDLEGTPFTDTMARLLSKSTSIRTLDLGATRLTRTGLESLVTMSQLRSIDLWATRLSESDLELLLELPHLEYLSIGGYSGTTSLDPKRMVSLILTLPSLKHVWLDGIHVTPAQVASLEERHLKVRAT
jgi:hypothetical protein